MPGVNNHSKQRHRYAHILFLVLPSYMQRGGTVLITVPSVGREMRVGGALFLCSSW
jgi:predicted metal-dependent RNase